MFCGERVHSSPMLPVDTSSPLASTKRTSTHGCGLPHDRSSSGRFTGS